MQPCTGSGSSSREGRRPRLRGAPVAQRRVETVGRQHARFRCSGRRVSVPAIDHGASLDFGAHSTADRSRAPHARAVGTPGGVPPARPCSTRHRERQRLRISPVEIAVGIERLAQHLGHRPTPGRTNSVTPAPPTVPGVPTDHLEASPRTQPLSRVKEVRPDLRCNCPGPLERRELLRRVVIDELASRSWGTVERTNRRLTKSFESPGWYTLGGVVNDRR